jgi:Type I restriction enzyme R protein N terminus (HSDR_N)
MNGHHLILGELSDFISGTTLKDTHDERYRQKIARLLVNRKGYLKSDIEQRKDLLVQAGEKRALVKIDFLINLYGKICMIVKYGPGSLVTRRRPVLAASRVLAPYQIPVAVVTNGEDAEILEGSGGSVLTVGLENIPSKSELQEIAARNEFKVIPAQRAAMESRIVYCYEVDDSCPCDEDICRL